MAGRRFESYQGCQIKKGGSHDTAKRRKRNNKPYISGYDKNEKLVLKNIFILHESKGVQLDILIEYVDQQGFLIDWIAFFEDSLKSKWNISTTLNRIQYALQDTHGKEYADHIIFQLKKYIDFKHYKGDF